MFHKKRRLSVREFEHWTRFLTKSFLGGGNHRKYHVHIYQALSKPSKKSTHPRQICEKNVFLKFSYSGVFDTWSACPEFDQIVGQIFDEGLWPDLLGPENTQYSTTRTEK